MTMKALVIAYVIGGIMGVSLQYTKAAWEIFGGLMALQMRYYVPKDQERLRYMHQMKVLEAKQGAQAGS